MNSRCIAVAWSGGRDSTALLHATLAAAASLGVRVVALHVHHGLSTNADAWLAFCEAQVRRWRRRHAVSLRVARLSSRPGRGESVEAWARRERYRALRQMAQEEGADRVLLAHHRRDQAETVLIQALRGGGVAGLAGMPRAIERDGVTWVRPWLGRDPEAIAAYVRRHRLKHIDDESNADRRFARNRLRLDVWPALERAFPQAAVSLADAAEWARQASDCLAEVAAADLVALDKGDGLDVKAWRTLSPARRTNALRAWLRRGLDGPATASLVVRLGDELMTRAGGSWEVEDGRLRLYRGRLGWQPASVPPAAAREATVNVRRAGRYQLPGWAGVLVAERVREGGVPLAWLGALDLRERCGGEQFQGGIGRPPRSLKKQFQSAGVPAWERDGPLMYSGGQLVFVPGLGLDARVVGLPGQAMVNLRWERAAPQ